jgi:hypothetical protein
MNMPGFTAEDSLRRAIAGYHLAWDGVELGNTVRPQFLRCDQRCQDCIDNCPDPGDCYDLPNPAARAACIRYASNCIRHCFRL